MKPKQKELRELLEHEPLTGMLKIKSYGSTGWAELEKNYKSHQLCYELKIIFLQQHSLPHNLLPDVKFWKKAVNTVLNWIFRLQDQCKSRDFLPYGKPLQSTTLFLSISMAKSSHLCHCQVRIKKKNPIQYSFLKGGIENTEAIKCESKKRISSRWQELKPFDWTRAKCRWDVTVAVFMCEKRVSRLFCNQTHVQPFLQKVEGTQMMSAY